jgi:hypothetical protein
MKGGGYEFGTYSLKASLLKQSWSLIPSKACFLNDALTQCKTSYA